jgi:hypothetical protein
VAASETYTTEELADEIAELRGQVDKLTEILSLQDGPLPNTPSSSGTELYSSSGNLAVVNSSGLQLNIPGAQTAFFPGNTVTAASLTNLASGTYLGNDADAGAIYEVEAWGNGTQGSTAQTLEFGVAWGGTAMTNTTFGTTAMPINQTFRWWARARVICHTTGASATWSSFVVAIINGTNNVSPGNANMGCATSSENNTTATKDSTVNQSLSLQAAWGSTTGAPTLTSQVAFFKRVC